VSGSFAHRKEAPTVAIGGAPGDAAAFREDVNGTNFTVSISGLPAGKYSITISRRDHCRRAGGARF